MFKASAVLPFQAFPLRRPGSRAAARERDVEVNEAGGDAGDVLASLVERLDPVELAVEQLPDPEHALADPPARHLVDPGPRPRRWPRSVVKAILAFCAGKAALAEPVAEATHVASLRT